MCTSCVLILCEHTNLRRTGWQALLVLLECGHPVRACASQPCPLPWIRATQHPSSRACALVVFPIHCHCFRQVSLMFSQQLLSSSHLSPVLSGLFLLVVHVRFGTWIDQGAILTVIVSAPCAMLMINLVNSSTRAVSFRLQQK